ncbi:MAG: discoidin domain-containing protein [Acetatifactor sp.]|nr:discoidin domain-containing protein [Acetatifactor sp.]
MKKIVLVLVILSGIFCLASWGYAIKTAPESLGENYGDITVVETKDQTQSEVPPYFVVEEYEPIIPEGTNIAELSRFDANGYNDVYLPGKAKDGNTDGASYWEGAVDSYPNILTAIFPETVSAHAIKVLLCPKSIWGARKQAFSIEVSVDGENFTELVASEEYFFDPRTNNEVVVEFDDTSFTAIRLNFTSNTGATAAQVAEFEIYSND